MAITYPLDLPARAFARIQWNHQTAVGVARSPFSFARQTQDHTGQCWAGNVSWDIMPREEKAEVISFLRKLDGPKGTFLMGVAGEEIARGSASTTPGTPVVDGSGQTGDSLNLRGLPISVSGYLLEDDLIQLGTGLTSRLYSVLEPVNVDVSGKATLTLWPDLRESPTDGDAVVVENAKGLFSQVDNIGGFSRRTVIYSGLGFEFVEAL